MTKRRRLTTITAMSLCAIMGIIATGITMANNTVSAATIQESTSVCQMTDAQTQEAANQSPHTKNLPNNIGSYTRFDTRLPHLRQAPESGSNRSQSNQR